MGRGRASKRAAVIAAGALAAVATIAPAAPADEAFPTCEVMLDQETCDKYYYGPLYTVGNEVIVPVYEAAFDAVDKVFEVAIWAGNTYDCTVWGMCD